MSQFLYTVVLGVALSGCAVGISGDSQVRRSFMSERPVDVVLDAAYAQALACLTGPGAYEVQRLPGGNSDSGSIVVRAPFTPLDIARVSASRQSAGTQVDITMWGRNLWDAKAAIAMADAITFNVVACHSYMPAAGAPKKG